MNLLPENKNATEAEKNAEGGWYADPYGKAARRWFDPVEGWSDDKVEGEGEPPDKTGVARLDEAAVAEPNDESHTEESAEARESGEAEDTADAGASGDRSEEGDSDEGAQASPLSDLSAGGDSDVADEA